MFGLTEEGIPLEVYFELFSSEAFEFDFDHWVPNRRISFCATKITKDGNVEDMRKETRKGEEKRREK